MKNGMTIEQHIAELEAKIKRAEAFERVLKSVDNMIEGFMVPEIDEPSRREKYIDEETGEEKTRYVWETYKKDENGNTIYHEPDEEHYNYKDYVALKKVRDEIVAIV